MARKEPLRGRPRSTRIKPEKARRLIRRFHVLLKNKAAAEAAGQDAEVRALEAEITNLGGLDMYQQASMSGQSKGRGGDSSRVLMEWLPKTYKGSLLEVGCLQIDNACAQANRFAPHVRIDLNSQHPQIQKQDFMAMPVEQFDVVSLSLVVNYVPDATARGEMMRKAHRHLKADGLLFFVLPRACIDNSRYCNDAVMHNIFLSVGYAVEHEKKTPKLVYWLLHKVHGTGESVAKVQTSDGSNRNNFSIVLE